jgi:hypothetical protein
LAINALGRRFGFIAMIGSNEQKSTQSIMLVFLGW